ncbi:MAG: radical SAM protein, partial [Archaeoglobaceae archaeon]
MEFNPFQKKFRKGEKKVALVYPNRYVGGIANVGLQLLYAKINEFAHCERFYLDVFGGLRSIESGTKLSEFDLALFSLQYENDYFKAVEIIRKSNFSGMKIAGGPCVMENPRPIMKFFDAVFIGEAEDCIEEIVMAKDVKELRGIEGIFTGVEEKVRRVFSKLGKHIEDEIIGDGAYGRCFLLEIGRGCVRKCTFCLVRQIYSPPRWRKIEDLPEIKEVKKVAIIAPSPTDHPRFREILQYFVERGFEISPSSIRADAVDEELVEILRRGKVRTLTLA